MPVESYATLLNLKLVVPSSKSNYVAVDRAFWLHSFGCQIAEIQFDEVWYTNRYADVSDAIRKGAIKNAKQHYCESGYFEHRMPFHIKVDERWYLAQYGDISDAIAKKLFGSAQEHFEEVGFKEGRHPSPGFSLQPRTELAGAAA